MYPSLFIIECADYNITFIGYAGKWFLMIELHIAQSNCPQNTICVIIVMHVLLQRVEYVH